MWMPLLALTALALAPVAYGQDCFETNVDYLGDDINGCGATAASAGACKDLCADTTGCTHFTYITTDFTRDTARQGQCCLKNGPGTRRSDKPFATGLTSGTVTSVACECPDGWTLNAGSCYKVFGERVSVWQTARDKCQAEGADLVQLETAAENTFLESLLDESYTTETGGDGTLTSGTDSWLGGKRANQGAAWKWVSGQNVATAVQDFPNNFDPSEDPNHCLQTYKNSHPNWRWYTANCDGTNGDNGYTCEKSVALGQVCVNLDCSSNGFAFAECAHSRPANAQSGLRIELVEKVSQSDCTLGTSYGLSAVYGTMWVNKGCRGKFKICSAEGGCGISAATCSLSSKGCWNDQNHQTGIPLIGRFQDQRRDDPKGDCLKHAYDNCFPGIAMQDGGTCRTGPAISTQYKKLGTRNNCNKIPKMYEGMSGLGGGWANNVYLMECGDMFSCQGGYLRPEERPTWVWSDNYDETKLTLDVEACKTKCAQSSTCKALTMRNADECFLSGKTTADADMVSTLGGANDYGNTYLYCTKN